MRGAAAGTGQVPPLWAWLTVGFAVDGAGLAGLFQLAARSAEEDVLLNLVLPGLSLLLVAWMSHVVIVPALLRAPGPKKLPEVLGALVFGGLYVPVALGVGGAVGGSLLVLLPPWFAMTGAPQTWFRGLSTVLFLCVYSAAGGAAAGAMAHAWRFIVPSRPMATWRLRSDVIGGALAAGLFAAGLNIFALLNPQGGPGAWSPLFLVGVVFPLVGTLALMPHLALLGSDLRRAVIPSHQPMPNFQHPLT